MKKILFIMLLIFSIITLSGCKNKEKDSNYNDQNDQSTNRDTDLKYLLLSKSEENQKYNNYAKYKEFVSLLGSFSTDLSESMYKEFNTNYDRITVSPISIYMALAMATGVAEKDAQEELVNLLGIPYEDIMEYTKYLYSRLNKERYDENNKVISSLLLNNSIWLNNILDYKNEGLELLKNSFYADSYSVPFTTDNELANKAVGDFVYRSTKGLIDSKYEFDTSTLFLLINTLYLKDVWNNFGDELNYTKDLYNFINKNNTISSINLLEGYYENGRVQEGNGFEYFYTKTMSNFKIYFIKPTTKNIDEIYTSQNLNLILNTQEYGLFNHDLKEEYFTRCLFPEFDASFDEDIVPFLTKEYGISKIFRTDVANFNKVTDVNAYVSQVIHQTKLDVNKKGIEGAAVTIIVNAGESAPFDEYTKIYSDFIIDQSFGFMIVYDDTILFSGVVNNL